MKPSLLYIILICTTLTYTKSNSVILDIYGGSSWSKQGADLELKSNYYLFPIDQMLFFGVGTGYRQYAQFTQIPLNSTLYIRLPMGQILMPVIRLSGGYLLGHDSRLYWSSELIGDLKLGNSSSLLFGGGIEAYSLRKIEYRPSLNIGLLIEK